MKVAGPHGWYDILRGRSSGFVGAIGAGGMVTIQGLGIGGEAMFTPSDQRKQVNQSAQRIIKPLPVD